MTAFALLPDAERTVRITEAAARLSVPPVIVEKDFWVCWLLGRMFSIASLGPHLTFKGGTSLSKVFGAIQRFSEDVDLSVAPKLLGWSEADLDEATSRNMRDRRFARLEADCIERVRGDIRHELERSVRDVLGPRPEGENWLEYEIDQTSNSPVLVFKYPSALQPESGYILPAVKLEFGSLTDQRPTGTHSIRPLLAEVIPGTFDDWQAEVVALEIERTFWEKATILHDEYHRPASQPIRDRLARHYSDMATLWLHPARQIAMDRLDLLDRVSVFKARFFKSRWSSFETAQRPTLKLAPPEHRLPALAQDYAKMEPMFLARPPSFADVMRVLSEAEATINAA
jgi:hypothetical protein